MLFTKCQEKLKLESHTQTEKTSIQIAKRGELTSDELLEKVSYRHTCIALIQELVQVGTFDVKDHHRN